MGMFYAADEPGFGLKTMDEIGVAGRFGLDDFNGHVTTDIWLEGAIDGAETTGSDLLFDLIPTVVYGRFVHCSLPFCAYWRLDAGTGSEGIVP